MSKDWQIPRRTFLRGLGTAIALPVFEAMLPSVRALADTAGGTGKAGLTPAGFPKRMAFVYTPNGANMAQWSPKGVGVDYQLSPTLEPLAAHKADMTVISGLAQRKAFGNGDGGGDHARASANFLTSCQPKKSASDIHAGISVDQVAANAIGDQTRFPSLELSCDLGQEAGSCDSGYSCAYQFNISWRSETQPMNPEIEPRAAFDRLFGSGNARRVPGGPPGARAARTRASSILSSTRPRAWSATSAPMTGASSTSISRRFATSKSASPKTARCRRPCPPAPSATSTPNTPSSGICG